MLDQLAGAPIVGDDVRNGRAYFFEIWRSGREQLRGGFGIYDAPEPWGPWTTAYYTTKKAGTGIGLAMAKRIAEEHGGQIGVRSDVGKGSDFWIALPIGADNPYRPAPE